MKKAGYNLDDCFIINSKNPEAEKKIRPYEKSGPRLSPGQRLTLLFKIIL